MASPKPARKKKGTLFPNAVTITEPDGTVVKMLVAIYYVGVYCAIYVNGRLIEQAGNHNQKAFVQAYLRDIKKALARGASVEEGTMLNLEQELERVAI
jgi:hypothetical protein